MTDKSKSLVLRAMEGFKSDDLERATAAFRGKTADQMQEQHGLSGRTRQEVLDGYRASREEWKTAMRELKALLK